MNYTLFAIIIVAATFVSCKDFNKTIKDTLSNSDSIRTLQNGQLDDEIASSNNIKEEASEMPFTAQKDRLLLAEQQLRALPQFAGKPIFIFKLVHFYDDGRIITKLQNPDNPAYIDAYHYQDGKWLDPKSVVLSKNDEISKNLMNLDRLPFVNVCNVYHVLHEKRQEINGTSSDYSIYAFTQNDEINWYPTSIGNERSVYEISYKEDGTLLSFEQQ